MPAAAADPLAGLGLARRGGHLLDDLAPVRGPGEVEDHLGFAQREVVGVAVDEAGDRQAAVEFDRFGFGADVGGDFAIATDRDDFEAANCDLVVINSRQSGSFWKR